jgi:hypothetical protein
MTAPAATATAADLAELLRAPVREVLAARAESIRSTLPPRPADAPGRYTWWRSLTPGQARRAVLLDRLEALCGHLDGVPALGYVPGDRLPLAAVEAADGFTSGPVADLAAAWRALR